MHPPQPEDLNATSEVCGVIGFVVATVCMTERKALTLELRTPNMSTLNFALVFLLTAHTQNRTPEPESRKSQSHSSE